MTLDTKFAGFYPPLRTAGTQPSQISLTSTSVKLGFMITIPVTGTLLSTSFKINTVSADGTITARVETINSSTGKPTGTLAYTNATGTLNVTTADTNPITIPINSPTGVTVTKGDKVGVVLTVSAGTGIGIYASNSLDTTQPASFLGAFPCIQYWNGSSWATTTTSAPCINLNYSIGPVCPMGCATNVTAVTTTIGTGTSPVIVGNRFTLPMKVVASGIWASGIYTGDCTAQLIGTDGLTVLASATIPAVYMGTTGTAITHFTLPTDITLQANAYYRVVIRATTSTTLSIGASSLAANVLGTYGAEDGIFGKCFEYTSSDTGTSEVSWTQDSTKRAKVGLYLSQLDIGGGSISGDLNGGFI